VGREAEFGELVAGLDEARFRLFDAAAGFVVERARSHPLVIVLDDQNIRPPETREPAGTPASDSTRQARHGHVTAVTCAALEREGELPVHRP
jgi:hypothetical protein